MVNPLVVALPDTQRTTARAESFVGNPLLERSRPDKVSDHVRFKSKKFSQIFSDSFSAMSQLSKR